jgi:hypothetical protein
VTASWSRPPSAVMNLSIDWLCSSTALCASASLAACLRRARLTIPPASRLGMPGVGLLINVECASGVRLTFSVPAGPLASVDCDPSRSGLEGDTSMTEGRLATHVLTATLDRLELRPGRHGPDHRPLGRPANQPMASHRHLLREHRPVRAGPQ